MAAEKWLVLVAWFTQHMLDINTIIGTATQYDGADIATRLMYRYVRVCVWGGGVCVWANCRQTQDEKPLPSAATIHLCQ